MLAARDIEIIDVPEEAIYLHGCNLQALGDHRVLSLKRNAAVNEQLAARGMDVIELDITEILGGRRTALHDIPAAARLESAAWRMKNRGWRG